MQRGKNEQSVDDDDDVDDDDNNDDEHSESADLQQGGSDPQSGSGPLPEFNWIFLVQRCISGKNFHGSPISSFYVKLLTDKQKDRQTGEQTDKQTDVPGKT